MSHDARERIENLWDRATPVGPLLDAYRDAILREAATVLWHQTNGLTEYGRGAQWAAGELRRMADNDEEDSGE